MDIMNLLTKVSVRFSRIDIQDWGKFSIYLGSIGPPDSTPKNVVGCGGNETGIGGVLVSPNYPVSHSIYDMKIYQIC